MRIQLSNKNASHADCGFADCMSTTMRSAMISLTPHCFHGLKGDCDLHKRGQSVPVGPSKRTKPEEKSLPWRDLGETNVSKDYLP